MFNGQLFELLAFKFVSDHIIDKEGHTCHCGMVVLSRGAAAPFEEDAG